VTTTPTRNFIEGVTASLVDDLSAVLAKLRYLGYSGGVEVEPVLDALATSYGSRLDTSLEVIDLGRTGWILGRRSEPARETL
jgi:hypothetical protein